jgi:hypothetical protein
MAYPGNPGYGVTVTPTGAGPGYDPCLDPLENQQYVTPWPYYSTVKFTAPTPTATPGPFAYTILAGSRRRAFAYAVGGDMRVAGYTQADGVATIAETNLISANETISGENVWIQGMALQLMPSMQHLEEGGVPPSRVRPPDANLLGEIFNSIAVSIGLNGDQNVHRLGTPGMLPGAGGLTGAAHDITGPLQVAGQTDANQGFPANGWPVRSNYFQLPEGLIWMNKGNRDSNLNIIFDTVRDINILSGGSPENNVAGIGGDLEFGNAFDAESTAQGYNYPTELVVGIKVILIGQVIGPRSRDQ